MKNNSTTNCKNCNQTFIGNFCNNCGQTADTHEINLTGILHEIQHSILHVDKGIIFTSKELFTRPGHTIRDYLSGKRVKHFKPFSYIFILSTLYALTTNITHTSNFANDFLIGIDINSTEKSSKNFGLLSDIIHWMTNHYAYATLIILPIISLSSYLSFINAKKNFFQHLILNTFLAGQITLFFLLLLPFTYFITDQSLNNKLDSIKSLISFAMIFWVYYQFFDTMQPLKKLLLTFLTYLIMLSLFLLLIIIIGLF